MKKPAILFVIFLIAFVGLGCDDDSSPGNTSPTSPVTSAVGTDGCSNQNYPKSGTYKINVNGTKREYIVTLPDNYDPSNPYRMVFAWHYMTGTAAGVAGRGGPLSYYGLKGRSNNSTIFVAGQGLRSFGTTGWANVGGRDVAFAKAMWEELSNNYCIDKTRVFSTGMSYGGIMSNTVGCAMGDVFRAIAPMSGIGPFSLRCTGQVAAWISHGTRDSILPFRQGQSSRDHWLRQNNCSEKSSQTSPSPCVAYEGCDDGYPVHWCQFQGGHAIPSFAAEAIWDFFMQF